MPRFLVRGQAAGLAASLTFALLSSCQSVPAGTSAGRPTPDLHAAQSAASPAAASASPKAVITAPQAGLAAPKAQLTAQVEAKAHGLRLAIAYQRPAGFSTTAIDCGPAVQARVSITGPGLSTPLYADGSDGLHRLPTAGCRLQADFSEIPYGLRIVTVELLDSGGTAIPGAILKGVLRLGAGSQNLKLSYRQLPAAETVEALIAAGPAQEYFAQHLDLAALQSRIDAYTGLGGSFPDETFTTHPSLIDSAALATDLYAGTPGIAEAYRLAPARLTVQVEGLLDDDRLSLNVGDPASVTTSFDSAGGSLSGIAPGTWDLSVSTDSEAGTSYSYSLSAASLGFAADGTQTLSVTATPASISLDAPSLSEIGTGQTLVLNGSGFHPDATAVSVGGQPATLTAVSATRIALIVPEAVGAAQTIRVSVGTRSATAAIDVRRIWYVNTAIDGGTGSGLSWANAFADLQDALVLATDGDEIRIAEGSYTPGGDRDDSFEIPAGVTVYGGFDADAPAENVIDRLSSDITTLSGEIGAAGDTSDNSYHVVTAAAEVLLDGVTITAGRADGAGNDRDTGGGMLNRATGVRLVDVIFSDNQASLAGGGLANLSAGIALDEVSFASNTAGESGGALYDLDSNVSLEQASFSANQASAAGSGRGGAIYQSGGSLSLSQASFLNQVAGHQGGGMYSIGTEVTLSDVVFATNSAGQGGGIYLASGSLTVSNGVFAGNSATQSGSAIMASGPLTLTNLSFSQNSGSEALFSLNGEVSAANLLFWQTSLSNVSLGAFTADAAGNQFYSQGNVIAADDMDPFDKSGTPAGPDGIWFTADDGLHLGGGSVFHNLGVESLTGFSIPGTDILAVTRPTGGYDPGAYEGVYTPPEE